MEELEGHTATMAWDWDTNHINMNEDGSKQWVPVTHQTMKMIKTPKP